MVVLGGQWILTRALERRVRRRAGNHSLLPVVGELGQWSGCGAEVGGLGWDELERGGVAASGGFVGALAVEDVAVAGGGVDDPGVEEDDAGLEEDVAVLEALLEFFSWAGVFASGVFFPRFGLSFILRIPTSNPTLYREGVDIMYDRRST
jgi:hypothetical protein